MRIAIIGTGISGLATAWLLHRRHDITVFEADRRVGGHTHTVRVPRADGPPLALDTGFIVFNRDRYPNLSRLFDMLGVESQETDMSFAVSCGGCGLEYSGGSLASLFAQKRNLMRPAFLGMLRDIARFGELGTRDLQSGFARALTLHEYLAARPVGDEFARHYLFPMAAALWSSGTREARDFPAETLLRFFANHGLLRLSDRLRWQTVVGGSHAYVRALVREFAHRIHVQTPIAGVTRGGGGVRVWFDDQISQWFDRVVIATHADQALSLLRDASTLERELLGAWRYSRNETWLHTDTRHLPRNRSAWASWNYLLPDCVASGSTASASYYLNRLQRLDVGDDYVVTLNPKSPPAPESVIRHMTYTHPVYALESVATQPDLPALNRRGDTFFCGAYFGYGFHEDGLRSALQVADAFGLSLAPPSTGAVPERSFR